MTAQAVTLFQQQKAFVRKRIEGYLFRAGKRVIPVAGEQELILEDDAGIEAPMSYGSAITAASRSASSNRESNCAVCSSLR